MTEIFKTNVERPEAAGRVIAALQKLWPGHRITIDLDDPDKVLRVEGPAFDPEAVAAAAADAGCACKVFPDRICPEAGLPEDQAGFWDASFRQHQRMWGWAPAPAAVRAGALFAAAGIRDVLIPGMGYGRNAQPFLDRGMKVSGIEISPTAVDLARAHFGKGLTIFYGAVGGMPFSGHRYGGIFCHALIHLLDGAARAKLIRDCFDQLSEGGYMVFSAISKEAATYGRGRRLGDDRYELFGGVRMYFYDPDTVQAEFGAAGLQEVQPVQDTYPLYLIICRKPPLPEH